MILGRQSEGVKERVMIEHDSIPLRCLQVRDHAARPRVTERVTALRNSFRRLRAIRLWGPVRALAATTSAFVPGLESPLETPRQVGGGRECRIAKVPFDSRDLCVQPLRHFW